MSELHELAERAGLQIEWRDAAGRHQRTGDDALRNVLSALGYPAEQERDIVESLDRCRSESHGADFVTGDSRQPVDLPGGAGEPGEAELELENGSARAVQIERAGEGLRLQPIDEIGYHRLHIGGRTIGLAIAPHTCFGIAEAIGDRRAWGAAVQVPSLCDGGGRAFGDFGSVARAASAFAARGADALAISPAHALFPADPARFSPYGPSSRAFLNILFGDPALVGQPLAESRSGDLIDWQNAIPHRLAALRAAFKATRSALADRIAAFRAEGGETLELHARFDALHAHFFDSGAGGWQGWPEDFQDARGVSVQRFAAEHRDEIEFYVFAQWLASESLGAAQHAATDAGMKIGLISDLAVGLDPGGSHGWSRGDELLQGLSVGAPPDPLGPHGQDWGLTTFSPAALRANAFEPLIATLRANIDLCGGIRIDHALGLNRLWVIPHGGSAADGAYLRYPLEDILRVLALESRRARAVVIGEDLGTVPPGLRDKLEEREVLGMRVLWFEREEGGRYIPPARWQRHAVAMTGTHDLFTVAGWWSGRDIDWARQLGRGDPGKSEEQDRAQRTDERRELWSALRQSGSAEGDPPPPEEPARAVDAATEHVASTPSLLALYPFEDVLGLREQPNLPGTTDEHPNWRRRMPAETAELLEDEQVARRIDGINARRRS